MYRGGGGGKPQKDVTFKYTFDISEVLTIITIIT